MYKQLSDSQKKIVSTYWTVIATRELAMSFFATTYVLFLLARGLNLFEVNLVNTVFFITLFVFEIPTGVVADVWGRKISVIISFIFTTIGMITYFFAQSFLACAVAEAISAIGFTFMTGAFDAWLIDELKHRGYQEQTRWIFGRSQQIGKLLGLGGALLGAFVGSYNLALPWLGGALMLTGGIFSAIFLMKEESFTRRPYSVIAGWQEMGQTFKAGLTYAKSSAPVRFLVAMGIIQSLGFMAPNMQWTPWFKELLGSTTNLGFMWWGIALALVLGAELAHAITGKHNDKWLLVLTQIAIGLCVALVPLSRNLTYAVSAFLLHEFGRGLYRPLKDAYLNATIPSKQRATLLSLDAMSFHIGGAVGLVVSGAIANTFGIATAWVLSGGLLIVGTLTMLFSVLRRDSLSLGKVYQ